MPLAAVWRHASLRPDDEAIVTGTERVTTACLQRRVMALMGHLRERGIRPTDIVPMALTNGADFVVAFLAVLGLGARPLPISPAWTPAERMQLLGDVSVPLALVEPGGAESWEPTPLVVAPFGAEPGERPGASSPSELAPSGLAPAAVTGAELAMDTEILLPTSGSTGTPRIVRLGMPGVTWNARAHAESVGLTAHDRFLVVSPMVHAATLVAQVIAGLLTGATLVCTRGPFMPRAFLKALEIERITATTLTPTHARMLLERGTARGIPLGDLSCLRWVSLGAAPADPALLSSFAGFLAGAGPARLLVTYGLSEAGPRVSTLPPERLADRAETVGRPLPGIAVRIVDGELHVKTPSRMKGYLGEPPLTDEWLATGDLASLDPEGFITLHGRRKELIVSGGVNVSPLEVERALAEDPRVSESAVVGRPHPLYGEVPVAYVVPARSVTSEDVTSDDLLAGLEGRLAPYKLPRELVLVKALPRTATGKVDKAQLKRGPEG